MNAIAHDSRTGGRGGAPSPRLFRGTRPVHAGDRRALRRPLRATPGDPARPRIAPRRDPPSLAAAAAIALAVTLPALVVTGMPSLTERCALDMQVLFAEPWRAVTGHWVHWTLDHLIWSGATFALLMLVSWGLDRRRTLLTLLAAIVAIPVGLAMVPPPLGLYGGLSGLDSALFVFAAVTLLRREFASRRRLTTVLLGALLAGFIGKVAFEAVTGGTVFTESAGLTGVPIAHAAGGASGLLVALAGVCTRRRPRSTVRVQGDRR